MAPWVKWPTLKPAKWLQLSDSMVYFVHFSMVSVSKQILVVDVSKREDWGKFECFAVF